MNKSFSLNIFKKSFFIIFAATLVVSGFFVFTAHAANLNVIPAKISIDNNTDFGSVSNEAVGIDVNTTLNDLFSGEGLQYTYTILNGGTYNGAAPSIAVIDLEDGRHIVLFPGWGDRTGTHTLVFNDSTASDTGGNNFVDFVIYPSDFSSQIWSSNAQYGNWDFLKLEGSSTGGPLPLTGDEVATKVSIQHQAANSGQEDRIESILINGVTYYGSIQGAINAANSGDMINVAAGAYELSAQLNITKAISIVGNGTVTIKANNPAWGSNNETKHLLSIYAGTESASVTISNIILDSNNECFGLNTYGNAYGVLNNVTILNSKGAGLTVNGSTIIATNLNTSGNLWGAVNVDPGSGVLTPSVFTLTSGNLAESKQIWSDGAHVSDIATVMVNAEGYSEYKVAGTAAYLVWANKALTNVAIISSDPTTLYTSIQTAINAATSSATINVAAGTYNEQIIVSKSLNLVGANTGISGNTTRSNESNIVGYVKINANNVSIDGFKFTDGTQVPAGEKSAVYIVGGHSGFEIKNNLFTRVGSAPYGFDQFRGIINEYGGINSIQITNNKFTGWHTGVYLQNAVATITNNVMDGNMVGMSVDGPNSVSVIGNMFNNNAFEGLGVGPGIGSYSLTVQQNIFSENITALANYISSYTLNAEKNWWGDSSGPTHSSNPSGTGDLVSDNVNFSPWYANADKTSVGGITITSGDGNNNELDLPLSVEITTNNLVVEIPASTTVSGPLGWDGTINAPTVKDVPQVTPSAATGYSTLIDTVIEVGFPDAKLTFSNAVRLLFPGKAGKRVGYVRTDGAFQEITTPCNLDDQTAADSQLTGDIEDCKIDVTPDLVVWTKHFTQFITYNTYQLIGSGSVFTPPAPSPLGDANGDNKVDRYDFSLMMANWGKIGSNICDLNNDSKVDKYDFALLMSNWSM